MSMKNKKNLNDDVVELFISKKYLRYDKEELNKKLDRYISENPIYINEIKNYLKESNEELYLKYAKSFSHIRGCFEVFGVEENIKNEEKAAFIPKKSESIKPCLEKNIRKEKKNMKKEYSRANKRSCYEKVENKNKKRREYKEKMDNVLKKIRSSK